MKKPKNKNTKAYAEWERRQKEKKELNEWKLQARERAKHSCEYCGRSDKLNVHHIIGKRLKALRTNLHNAVVLCPNCHKFLIGLAAHENPIRLILWLIEHRPKSWQYLKEFTKELLYCNQGK